MEYARYQPLSYLFPCWELWLFFLPGTLSPIKLTKYDMEGLYLKMSVPDAYLMQTLLGSHTSIIKISLIIMKKIIFPSSLLCPFCPSSWSFLISLLPLHSQLTLLTHVPTPPSLSPLQAALGPCRCLGSVLTSNSVYMHFMDQINSSFSLESPISIFVIQCLFIN